MHVYPYKLHDYQTDPIARKSTKRRVFEVLEHCSPIPASEWLQQFLDHSYLSCLGYLRRKGGAREGLFYSILYWLILHGSFFYITKDIENYYKSSPFLEMIDVVFGKKSGFSHSIWQKIHGFRVENVSLIQPFVPSGLPGLRRGESK